MRAVVIGPGRIGCGFVGQLLRISGYDLTFAARNPRLVAHFNRVGQYRVRLVDGTGSEEVVIDGVNAVSTSDRVGLADAIARADLVATAVGPRSLADVAPLIAAGLHRKRTAVNVLSFENLADAGPVLRELVRAVFRDDPRRPKQGFSSALVFRAVTHRLGDPDRDEPLLFMGDPPATFMVDARHLVEPCPEIVGMIPTDTYRAWVLRKLYTFSAGHATTAYLGHLKGYHYIHTAIRDPEIRAAVLKAMAEGQRGLRWHYGPEIAGTNRDLKEIIHRFENPALCDPIVRVGRDPRRKLGPDDRLVGAARLADEAGIRPERLALAVAAALCFHDPTEPVDANLQHEIETVGLEAALRGVSGLDPRQGLGRIVTNSCRRLSAGWEKDNLLLSLDRMMWAWQSDSSQVVGSVPHEPR